MAADRRAGSPLSRGRARCGRPPRRARSARRRCRGRCSAARPRRRPRGTCGRSRRIGAERLLAAPAQLEERPALAGLRPGDGAGGEQVAGAHRGAVDRQVREHLGGRPVHRAVRRPADHLAVQHHLDVDVEAARGSRRSGRGAAPGPGRAGRPRPRRAPRAASPSARSTSRTTCRGTARAGRTPTPGCRAPTSR